MSNPHASSPEAANRWLKFVRPGELKRVGLAFTAFFLLMCGYYILRPVRDLMAVQTGYDDLQWLFTGTFVFTLIITPIFGWAVKRVSQARLLQVMYGFVIACLVGFHLWFLTEITIAGAAAFYIWLSVFNLFIVSLFWSNVSDSFTTEQSHRLYGYIAAGGTVGALAGPALTVVLARHVETSWLLLVSAGILALAAACVWLLRREKIVGETTVAEPIGGSVWAGVGETIGSPELRGLAALVMSYSLMSTILSMELTRLVSGLFSDLGERTSFFASVDLAVNILALIVQTLVTRRLVKRFGLVAALTIVPLVVMAGFMSLAIWPTVALFVAIQTLHRAGEFSLVKPGREMIFTTVDRESRYKAKNFIDTAVNRGNDCASSWLVKSIWTLGENPVLLLGVPGTIAWLAVARWLGRRHDRRESAASA